MERPEIRPEILRWARQRAGLSVDDLSTRFPRYGLWENGDARPTLKQLESVAKATFTPIGFLFLAEPPVEQVPIPDLRTIANRGLAQPSPDLLETVYLCQQRQAWYREFARVTGEPPREFIGSAGATDSVEVVAARMRAALVFNLEQRREASTWTDALRQFIAQAEALGVLVMCSGVVLNNNRRKLNPQEFRGFAISDDLAPLVFINGADTKAAQMFTLAHELAHLWIGQSALSDAASYKAPDIEVERWCNRVAAELLVPMRVMRNEYRSGAALDDEMTRLARRFKVSTLVVLRRIFDLGAISEDEHRSAFDAEMERLLGVSKGKTGGDFYLTQAARVSKRFARALVTSTLEGQTLYRDAFRMLGISKIETFRELGRSLESPV